MNIGKALDEALRNNTKKIQLTKDSKIVLLSDLHRGVGDWADDFVHNALVYSQALDYYLQENFTYIELGDGDELYENRKLVNIMRAHGNVFRKLNEFHKCERLCIIWGNHDQQKNSSSWLKGELEEYNKNRSPDSKILEDLEAHATAMLGDKIFLFHGHQGDTINDRYIWFGRWCVRYIWRPLQNSLGWKDPTSPAQRVSKRNKVENGILDWARKRRMIAIAGHTHRPKFCSLGKDEPGQPEPYYFNCGSGVHPRCITCLEIQNMEIELVKWHIATDSENRAYLQVKRVPIENCKKSLPELFSEL